MFGEKAKCSICEKEIKVDDIVFIRMRYPKHKGMTEIQAYLKSEGKFICEECFNKK